MTQNESLETLLALCSAMIQDDKEARDMIMDDLEKDDLKRVLRWSIRWFLGLWFNLGRITGTDPMEAWKAHAMGFSQAIAEAGDKDV